MAHKTLTSKKETIIDQTKIILDNPDVKITKYAGTSESQVYEMLIPTFLIDTNAYGNIYFSRYFNWQGMTRESFFITCIHKEMLSLPIKLVTKNAYMNYYHEVLPFQKIRATINTRKIHNVSVELVFNFFENEKSVLVASGGQTIVFMSFDKKFVRIPNDIAKKLKGYEIS